MSTVSIDLAFPLRLQLGVKGTKRAGETRSAPRLAATARRFYRGCGKALPGIGGHDPPDDLATAVFHRDFGQSRNVEHHARSRAQRPGGAVLALEGEPDAVGEAD